MGKRINLAELANDEVELTSSTSTSALEGEPSSTLPVEQLALNPLNKRDLEADEDLASMVDTIGATGIVQPLVVCSAKAYLTAFPEQHDALGKAQWVTLIGNRRLQAARLVGLDSVPVLINDEQAASMYEVMLVENGQRRDLEPVHEAEAMQEVLDAHQLSRRELARRIGRTHTYINQRLALLGLIPALRDVLAQGELKVELARQFGELPTKEQQAIVAAGKPYRPLNNGESAVSGTRSRRIQATSPTVAAESIRKTFTIEELKELIRLLTTATEQ